MSEQASPGEMGAHGIAGPTHPSAERSASSACVVEHGLSKSAILGVRFVAEPYEVVIRAVVEHILNGDRSCEYLCATGVHGVVEGRSDPLFREILNNAAFNVADGMPVVVVSRILGHRRAERAFGPDVMWSILAATAGRGVKHFFYGGKPGVADLLAQRASDQFPGLEVVGTYCPPFRVLSDPELSEISGLIRQSRADVVWVGLSTPKQERWIADVRGRLPVKLLCSVGAAFDYHTGSIKPAPSWMQRLALEWLFRLIQEPRRLWRRYLKIVPTFLILVALQLMGVRSFQAD